MSVDKIFFNPIVIYISQKTNDCSHYYQGNEVHFSLVLSYFDTNTLYVRLYDDTHIFVQNALRVIVIANTNNMLSTKLFMPYFAPNIVLQGHFNGLHFNRYSYDMGNIHKIMDNSTYFLSIKQNLDLIIEKSYGISQVTFPEALLTILC